MINLEYQGSTTSVILRLRQISELTNPYYLFQLTNTNTKVDIWMTADDISVAPGLYQEFYWRNGVSGLTQGNFIGYPGEYIVNIYETQYRYNLNPGSASQPALITDVMRIHGTAIPQYSSYTQSDNMTFVFYTSQ